MGKHLSPCVQQYKRRGAAGGETGTLAVQGQTAGWPRSFPGPRGPECLGVSERPSSGLSHGAAGVPTRTCSAERGRTPRGLGRSVGRSGCAAPSAATAREARPRPALPSRPGPCRPAHRTRLPAASLTPRGRQRRPSRASRRARALRSLHGVYPEEAAGAAAAALLQGAVSACPGPAGGGGEGGSGGRGRGPARGRERGCRRESESPAPVWGAPAQRPRPGACWAPGRGSRPEPGSPGRVGAASGPGPTASRAPAERRWSRLLRPGLPGRGRAGPGVDSLAGVRPEREPRRSLEGSGWRCAARRPPLDPGSPALGPRTAWEPQRCSARPHRAGTDHPARTGEDAEASLPCAFFCQLLRTEG